MQSEPHVVAVEHVPFPTLAAPSQDGLNAAISVSTRFNPDENDFKGANIILLTEDQVYFYVHREILLSGSSNKFGSLLPDPARNPETEIDVSQPMNMMDLVVSPTVIAAKCASDVLNVALHFIYGRSVESYRPSPSTLRAATTALHDFGYSLLEMFVPHSEPYMLFLQAAVVEPLPMYAIAAQYSLESLAIAVSTFTLSVSPSEISDELAQQMGPIYLRRLFFLHLGRAEALKRLLYPPPSPHLSIEPGCDQRTQYEVSRIWALACASVVVESQPNEISKVVSPLSAQLACFKCRQALHERVTTLIQDWSTIKATI
ncbi:40S ribosomal protein S14 [Ceratobasidium sp. AG-Ba]|nr:40S ribosomal protein S14 [Ceratobasidium sp. AG-Ba]QRW04091.1 hypothetical protein RhiLY_03090 [Ceratobasidium sp. AG-Ba]